MFVYDFTTASIHQMTRFGEDDQYLSHVGWSADGSAIVFDYTPSRTNSLLDYTIWTLEVGSDSAQSVTGGRFDACPAWLTNRSLVFVRYTNSPRAPEVLRLSLGPAPVATPLTFDGKIWKSDLAVSRDARWIAYSGSDYTGRSSWVLYLLPAAGGASRRLTAPLHGNDGHPAWHSDGRTLCFASSRSGHYEIWSVDSVSGRLEQVTRSQVRNRVHFGPALPADGTRLACFASSGSATTIVVLAR